jgi:hypothetical protein
LTNSPHKTARKWLIPSGLKKWALSENPTVVPF